MKAATVAMVTSGIGMLVDTDLRLIVEALRSEGLTAEPVPWDAEPAVWEKFDLAVIRSTWDYAERIDEFLAWADSTARSTQLCNPAEVIRWNSDKRYLLDLAAHGVPVVPTRFIEPGEQCGEGDFRSGGAVVVKPAVSAGAADTARYEPGQYADALRHARSLLDRGRVVMVQPYLPLVAEGERALVFFSGTFSHAVRKGPVLTEPGVIDNDRVPHPDLVPYQPTDEELGTATAALAAVPSPDTPLFARVDLALDDTRSPVVMELELIEPNLFLQEHPQGLERFAGAVATELRRASS
ncbi:RimK family alpha-L-glutamate ligase [Streptomyces sp. NPDC059828]|uniref:ATP-grasp domain-containing protein n=1 Tax=Streptomyces sp. NPDC059828 TaxID=3346965 RepID=UPI0036539A82